MKTRSRSITVCLSAIFLLYFLIEIIDSADGLNFLYGLAFISISLMCAAFIFHDIDLRDARKKIKELRRKIKELEHEAGYMEDRLDMETATYWWEQ